MAREGAARQTEKKTAAGNAEKNPSLEEMLFLLEKITTELETEELPLEEAFEKYSKGMELLKKCNAEVDMVEKKLQILEEA